MNDNDGVLLWVMQVSGEKSWKNTLGWTRRGKSGWGWPKVGTGAVHLLSQGGPGDGHEAMGGRCGGVKL